MRSSIWDRTSIGKRCDLLIGGALVRRQIDLRTRRRNLNRRTAGRRGLNRSRRGRNRLLIAIRVVAVENRRERRGGAFDARSQNDSIEAPRIVSRIQNQKIEARSVEQMREHFLCRS